MADRLSDVHGDQRGAGRTDGSRATLRFVGDLDAFTATSLALDVAEALADRPAAIEIDLAATTFIDSAGIQMLIRAWRLGRGLGVDVVATNVPRTIARAVSVCGLCGHGPFRDLAGEPRPAWRPLGSGTGLLA